MAAEDFQEDSATWISTITFPISFAKPISVIKEGP